MPKTAQRFEIPGRTVHWFESVGSTMTIAAELARQGCAHGTVVIADEQTAGIGRHGHSWHSAKGAGLYVSIVLRHPVLKIPNGAPMLMLALGLAIREAIVDTTGLQSDLRWPNDVLLRGRKCAGVISQMEGSAVIAGIGINVSQTAFPEGIDATSLLLAGALPTREELLTKLAHAVDRWSGADASAILSGFEAASSYARGRRVRLEDRAIEGVTQGLDPSGFLIVRGDDGLDTTVLAGGVRPCS